MSYLGPDGRERKSRFRERPGAQAHRACDGWPELGSCSYSAMSRCDYCRECETLRRAHEGEADVTDDDDEEGSDD